MMSMATGVLRSTRSHPGMGSYPEVAPFTAEPGSIRAGDTARLSWVTHGVESVILVSIPQDRPEGAAEIRGLPPTGVFMVRPQETTNYFLRCQTGFSGRACAGTAARIEVQKGPPQFIESGFGGN